jgi:hypothetical protein
MPNGCPQKLMSSDQYRLYLGEELCGPWERKDGRNNTAGHRGNGSYHVPNAIAYQKEQAGLRANAKRDMVRDARAIFVTNPRRARITVIRMHERKVPEGCAALPILSTPSDIQIQYLGDRKDLLKRCDIARTARDSRKSPNIAKPLADKYWSQLDTVMKTFTEEELVIARENNWFN